MKKLYFYFILCILSLGFVNNISAQSLSCSDAFLSPFCNAIAQYPANFTGTGAGQGPQAPVGPNYDCLVLQPNPTYFSLTIQQSGSINFTLQNSANSDIDFILWGPFSSIAAAGSACPTMGTGGASGGVADCSYSIAGSEQVSIANALAGDVYILMVTNFANTATNIGSTPNSGTGGVACGCDVPSIIDTMSTANGNQGYRADTSTSVKQFVVCPNNPLGIEIRTGTGVNDTVRLFAPFTTVNNTFPGVNTVFEFLPNFPSYDSLIIYTVISPNNSHIGVHNFNIGIENSLFTGGLPPDVCFGQLNIEVVVPGVRLTDRNVCSGEVFQIITDTIPTTTVGSSVYSWSQLSGPVVNFSSTTAASPTVTIPSWSSTSSSDSVVIEVSYNYGGLCPMKDTMVLRFPDISLNITATPDTICSGQTSNLFLAMSDTLTPAICSDYNVTTIPFAPLATTGTSVTTYTATNTFFPASDEGISAALPIGFNFNFYCNNYTNFYVHTNGFITFTTIAPSGNILGGAVIPNTAIPNNLIALSWQDLDVSLGGTVRYYVTGAAPNRKLVVSYNSIQYWGGGASITSQAILSESDNSIEIHIASNNLSTTFGGSSIVGIENATGAVGHFPATLPGGEITSTISNVAYRFTQKNFGPFYAWSSPGTLSSATIHNPIASPTTTTSYVVTVSDGACRMKDTVTVNLSAAVPTPTVMCDNSGLTSLSFSWSDLGLPGTGFYEYSVDGGVTWVNVGATFAATASGLISDSSYTIMVRANDGTGGACPLSSAGTTTCTTLNPSCVGVPAVNIILTPTMLACNLDSNACITSLVTGGSGSPMMYNWSNGVINVDSICSLPAGAYTLTITDTIPGGSSGPPMKVSLYAQAFDGATHGWTLNTSTGSNSGTPNVWQVNDTESGVAPPGCGTAGTGNKTLHITCTSLFCGSFITGAVYNATQTSNTRAESPVFSTVGQSNITLSFNFIANGNGLLDNGSLVYNDGSGWQVLTPSLKSTICGNGQGRWTASSITLPASCNNNPTVRIGFNWTNNADNIGTDPAIAIDSVDVFVMTPGGSSTIACITTQSVTIVEPTPFVVAVDSFTNPFCSGSTDGTISITASGGTPTYTYLWSANADTNEDITGLSNGTYTVTATDMNGCTATDLVSIAGSGTLTVTIDSFDNPFCSGNADGTISITTTGGTPAYTYLWSANGDTNEDITGLNDGTFTVTATDANGCTGTNQATLTVPNPILITIDSIYNNSCDSTADGSIFASATGGVGALSFTWDDPAGSTTDDVTTLINGTYNVTVTDTNGCQDTAFATIVPTIFLTASDVTVDPNCSGDSATSTITVLGGSGNYSFDWGTASATNTDMTTIGTTGAYIITITDTNNGCTTTDSVTVTIPTALVLTLVDTVNIGCNDAVNAGAIDINITGGTTTTPYTFLWDDASASTTEDISGLIAGDYTVTITDANGCTISDLYTVERKEPIGVTAALVSNNSCNGVADGSVSAVGLGGSNITYLWSPSAATTPLVTGLSNGIHYVTATNDDGCTAVDSAIITPVVVLTAPDSVYNVPCNGGTVNAVITVSGSANTYTFNWGIASTSTTNTATPAAGTYTITFTDNVNTCTGTTNITVTEPAAALSIVSPASITNIGCGAAANSGAIDITVTGGTANYTYVWDNSATSQDLTSLTIGGYSVVVTDANACTTTASYTITQATGVSVTITTLTGMVDCNLSPIGSLQAVASGGTGITYSWSNTTSDTTASNLAVGTYTVTVMNSDGCTATVSEVITGPVVPTLNATADGMSSVTVTGGSTVNLAAGSTGFSYNWVGTADPASGTPGIVDANQGTTTANPDPDGDFVYIVTASATTSGTTCTAMDTVYVTVEQAYQGIPNAFSPGNGTENNTFRPIGLTDQDIKTFRVYNRWGQEVFNGDEKLGLGWDGTYQGAEQAADVYLYLLIYQKVSDPEQLTIRGEVTLLR